MKLLLCPNKNENPPVDSCDLVEDERWSSAGLLKESRRIAHAMLPVDLFLEANRNIYDRLRAGEEVEIEIKEII